MPLLSILFFKTPIFSANGVQYKACNKLKFSWHYVHNDTFYFQIPGKWKARRINFSPNWRNVLTLLLQFSLLHLWVSSWWISGCVSTWFNFTRLFTIKPMLICLNRCISKCSWGLVCWVTCTYQIQAVNRETSKVFCLTDGGYQPHYPSAYLLRRHHHCRLDYSNQ